MSDGLPWWSVDSEPEEPEEVKPEGEVKPEKPQEEVKPTGGFDSDDGWGDWGQPSDSDDGWGVLDSLPDTGEMTPVGEAVEEPEPEPTREPEPVSEAGSEPTSESTSEPESKPESESDSLSSWDDLWADSSPLNGVESEPNQNKGESASDVSRADSVASQHDSVDLWDSVEDDLWETPLGDMSEDEPGSEPESTPETGLESTSESVAELEPESESTVGSDSELSPWPEPELVSETESEPASKLEPTPELEPVSEQEAQLEPAVEPTPEPVEEPKPESETTPEATPEPESIAESEPVSEPVAEPTPEPMGKPVEESVEEEKPEAKSEPTSEPTVEDSEKPEPAASDPWDSLWATDTPPSYPPNNPYTVFHDKVTLTTDSKPRVSKRLIIITASILALIPLTIGGVYGGVTAYHAHQEQETIATRKSAETTRQLSDAQHEYDRIARKARSLQKRYHASGVSNPTVSRSMHTMNLYLQDTPLTLKEARTGTHSLTTAYKQAEKDYETVLTQNIQATQKELTRLVGEADKLKDAPESDSKTVMTSLTGQWGKQQVEEKNLPQARQTVKKLGDAVNRVQDDKREAEDRKREEERKADEDKKTATQKDAPKPAPRRTVTPKQTTPQYTPRKATPRYTPKSTPKTTPRYTPKQTTPRTTTPKVAPRNQNQGDTGVNLG